MHTSARHFHKDPFQEATQLDVTVHHMQEERKLDRYQLRPEPIIPAGIEHVLYVWNLFSVDRMWSCALLATGSCDIVCNSKCEIVIHACMNRD
jgi:hypothetical protein